MTKRTLMITLTADWRAALRAAGKRAAARSNQGEVLDFETAGSFFGELTERRWALVHALQGQGAMSVRELARRVTRVARRVHDDVEVLAELGLFEHREWRRRVSLRCRAYRHAIDGSRSGGGLSRVTHPTKPTSAAPRPVARTGCQTPAPHPSA